MRAQWLLFAALLLACRRVTPEQARPDPVASASAETGTEKRTNRLLYKRSKPVPASLPWCEWYGSGLLAREEDHVVEVSIDGTIRHHPHLVGHPCPGTGSLLAVRPKPDEQTMFVGHEVAGEVREFTMSRGYCTAQPGGILLRRMGVCGAGGMEFCAGIEQHSLPPGPVTVLVPFHPLTFPNYALLDAGELVWIGGNVGDHGIWSTMGGKTRKIAPQPFPGGSCCEFALTRDHLLLAEQGRVLQVSRTSGEMKTLFTSPEHTVVRSIVFADGRVTFAYGNRLAEMQLSGGDPTTLLETTSPIERFARSGKGERFVWCEAGEIRTW